MRAPSHGTRVNSVPRGANLRLKRVATTAIMLIVVTGGLSGQTATANEPDAGDTKKEIKPPSFMVATPLDTPFAERRQAQIPQVLFSELLKRA